MDPQNAWRDRPRGGWTPFRLRDDGRPELPHPDRRPDRPFCGDDSRAGGILLRFTRARLLGDHEAARRRRSGTGTRRRGLSADLGSTGDGARASSRVEGSGTWGRAESRAGRAGDLGVRHDRVRGDARVGGRGTVRLRSAVQRLRHAERDRLRGLRRRRTGVRDDGSGCRHRRRHRLGRYSSRIPGPGPRGGGDPGIRECRLRDWEPGSRPCRPSPRPSHCTAAWASSLCRAIAGMPARPWGRAWQPRGPWAVSAAGRMIR